MKIGRGWSKIGEKPVTDIDFVASLRKLCLDGVSSHYSPELNPAERFFEELRRETKNRIFSTVDEIQEAIVEILKRFWENPKLVTRLTKWGWMERVHF